MGHGKGNGKQEAVRGASHEACTGMRERREGMFLRLCERDMGEVG